MAFSVTCIHVTHGRYNHIEGATIKDGSPFEYTSRTDKQPIHIDQGKRAGGGGGYFLIPKGIQICAGKIDGDYGDQIVIGKKLYQKTINLKKEAHYRFNLERLELRSRKAKTEG